MAANAIRPNLSTDKKETLMTTSDPTQPFREKAVAAATEFWKQGISEARRGSLAPIAIDSGWDKFGDLRKSDGSIWPWCGMFVAASHHRAGLCKTLRPGFYDAKNVAQYFTYEYSERTPRWVWSPARSEWFRVRDHHAEEGALRTWIDHATLQSADPAALDIRPGDVALIDHQNDGKPDHITLVESYDPATGMLRTLEGNGAGTVATRLNPDGTVVEGHAAGDAAVRSQYNLADPAKRKKLYGIGRLSALDYAVRVYEHADHKPATPPAEGAGRGP